MILTTNDLAELKLYTLLQLQTYLEDLYNDLDILYEQPITSTITAQIAEINVWVEAYKSEIEVRDNIISTPPIRSYKPNKKIFIEIFILTT